MPFFPSRRQFLLLLASQTTAAVMAVEGPAKAPIASNPVVELTGPIVRVNPFGAASSMPSLEIATKTGTVKVILGSMRYLLEKNFNPKAGAEVYVRGYKLDSGVVAIEIRQAGKTLLLRDEQGWPMWRGGGWRGGHKQK